MSHSRTRSACLAGAALSLVVRQSPPMGGAADPTGTDDTVTGHAAGDFRVDP